MRYLLSLFVFLALCSFDMPTGWHASGSAAKDYDMGVDAAVKRNGKEAYTVKSNKDETRGFGTLMTDVRPDIYKGKRIRLTAYLKTANLSSGASMWLRVDGKEKGSLGFDNMSGRSLKGTTDWTKCELVLDVPEEATNIAYGGMMAGTGQIWFADVTVEVVEKAVAVTDMNTHGPQNMDLKADADGTLKGWYKAGSHPDAYEMTGAPSAGRNKKDAATIRSTKDEIKGFGTLMQSMLPGDYRGKRVKLTGYVKAKDVKVWAGMWMRVDGETRGQSLSFDNMNDRPIKGTTDWTRCEIVLDVPEAATNVSYGVLLSGTGQVWFGELKMEVVNKTVRTTDENTHGPQNMDLKADADGTLKGWYKAGSHRDSYEMIGAPSAGRNKKDAATIRSTEDEIKGFGTLMQDILPADYKGKRVKLTGYVKAKDVKEWAGMWMRVDGETKGQSLSFDNMNDRPIKGTTDWTRCEIVLDVPEAATNIAYGVLLSGTGQVWFSELKMEVVEKAVPATDIVKKDASNLDLVTDANGQVAGWFKAGTNPADYEMTGIAKGGQNKRNAATIRSLKEDIKGFGTLMQNFSPDKYKGRRVRLSGYMKAQNVEEWAGFWLRIDGAKQSEPLAFDNMGKRPITGTADWTRCEVVLNVPLDAINIAYGVLLSGTGQVWFEGISIEVVDDTVPVTDLMVDAKDTR